jgi:peptide/nickel transport system permease protein
MSRIATTPQSWPGAGARGGAVPARRARARRHRDARLTAGVTVVAIFALAGAFAPLVAPMNPVRAHYDALLTPPSRLYPLGTDEFGRDILSRLIWGGRASLAVSGGGVCAAALGGAPLGLLAGYYGKAVDLVLMRFVELIMVFPPIFFALAIVSLVGPGPASLVVVVGVTYLPRFARLAYVSTKAARAGLFVEASHASGASDTRIFRRHILPNILSPLLVQACLALGFGIILEGSLSFLGYGIQPPAPSWGGMISSARVVIAQAPLVLIWPSAALSLCVFAINLTGDGLRDMLDPRLRGGVRA